MLILYAGLKHDYGQRRQGYSFEHYNFYDSLARMGHDILYFDLGDYVSDRGKAAANRTLLETVKSERPQFFFAVMFREELEKDVLREISTNTDTTTAAWFSDDHWRFDTYSREWAHQFNWVITTSAGALSKYRALGVQHVIKSQWACNTFVYAPMDLPQRLPVSFVGVPHGDRRFIIQALGDAGIEVHTFGKGWDRGRVTQDEMIRIFNQSCVNLNLANASAPHTFIGRAVALLLRALGDSSLPTRARATCVRTLSMVDHATRGPRQARYSEQIKGRNFEVPGCGAFLLTAPAENLDQYYVPGVEVGCYRDTTDLVKQVRSSLADPERRASIAAAGYQRTIREHTWIHRFATLFAEIGLPPIPVERVLSGAVSPGNTDEVR